MSEMEKNSETLFNLLENMVSQANSNVKLQ